MCDRGDDPGQMILAVPANLSLPRGAQGMQNNPTYQSVKSIIK